VCVCMYVYISAYVKLLQKNTKSKQISILWLDSVKLWYTFKWFFYCGDEIVFQIV
jgi:hypothetical protein